MILSAPYLLLSRADFEQPADPLRALNITGRWAIQGSVQSPLLAWLPSQAEAASAAAARASEARACAVVVVSQSDTRAGEGSATAVFTEAFESALTGPTPHSAAKTRRLRTETDKLEAFCRVVRAASAAADQPAFAAVGRAASKALRAKFGGGSITSAFAWLAGPAGREALESVLTGEVELDSTLSIRQVVEAVKLAQEAEHLRALG
ncbi:hypothetical protein EAH83_02720 [Variovorax ginsengisoli]|uniref:Uncharacterized protein n=1 Tax=Variovorax guangxiensis TaxID=1775474 RepID=A0A502E0G5_9BURK|nr:hypothetical protein EAH83_02720 [Variovorax ginsengisoli]TPG30419.1 hypothetical protein EAH82_02720 [Variovorax guangxiensis]